MSRSALWTPWSVKSCRPKSCGCKANYRRRSCSSPTTSTRRSSSATRSRCSAAAVCCSSTTNRSACCRTLLATGLSLHDIRTVAETEIDGLTLGPSDWVLILKSDGTPLGWVNAEGVQLHRKGSSLYDSTYGGGSLFRPDDSLRQALDAALSSPSGLGVAVDDDGRPVGGVLADDVLAALNTQRPKALPKLGPPERD